MLETIWQLRFYKKRKILSMYELLETNMPITPNQELMIHYIQNTTYVIYRVCRQCDSGEVEDVIHLFRCQRYEHIRHDMNINNNNSITELLSNNSHLKTIANYVIQAMTERT